jgi:hypothetical protein
MSEGTIYKLLVVYLVVGLALLFVFWLRRKGYMQKPYSQLRPQEISKMRRAVDWLLIFMGTALVLFSAWLETNYPRLELILAMPLLAVGGIILVIGGCRFVIRLPRWIAIGLSIAILLTLIIGLMFVFLEICDTVP